MGKPTGFMEYPRQGDPCESPLERIKHYNEFHPRLGRDERRRQGARCMACGVPFCQSGAVLGGMVSGCPLHNLVPEWNDLVYRGHPGHAAHRLLATQVYIEPFVIGHTRRPARVALPIGGIGRRTVL